MLTKEAIKNGSSPVKRKRIMCPSRQSFGRYVWYWCRTRTQLLFKHSESPPFPVCFFPPQTYTKRTNKSVFKAVLLVFLGFGLEATFLLFRLDLTEHDWLPIESLFRFIVFAHSLNHSVCFCDSFWVGCIGSHGVK